MKKVVAKVLGAITMLSGIGMTAAHAADVTFNVNMYYRIQQGQFTAGTDAVTAVIGGATVALTDPDGDKIYAGTLTGQTTAAQITYSYRFTHGGATTNESVAARKYVVQSYSSANVLDDWFNDQLPTYPYANFFASSVKTIPGEIVRFNDSSQGAAATSWSWSFPGANPASSTAQNPTTTWTSPGTYTVTMTATGGGTSTTKTMSVTVVSTTADALGWWNDAVFYQIYPRSFFDTGGVVDSRNSGAIGDFQGMIQKLDYLNDGNAATSTDLGVTALYIMPVHDATQPWFGGYEVNDYKSIIGELGTKTDFDQFVAAAHARGMKVIMDMVFNHTSLQNQWFTQGSTGTGQYNNYYVYKSTAPSGNWFSNPVSHTDANFNNYYAFFGQTTTDLNFNSSSVRNTIKDVSKYWLDQKADGFRLDAPMFLYEKNNGVAEDDQRNLPITYEYWRNWRKYLKDNPSTQQASPFSVGETWLPNKNDIPTAAKYVYQGFDIGFQFDVAYGVQNALNNENKNNLQDKVEQSMSYYPFLQFGVMLSNHDMGVNGDGGNPRRFKDRLSNNQDAKAKVAATFLLTTPGVPFVYFGDEVGAAGGAWSRAPMRWTPGANAGFTAASSVWEPIGTDYTTNNVQTQDATAGSILKLYRTLIKTRLASTALRQGKYTTVSNASTGVYTFARTAGSETVFVILNMAAAAQNNVALSVALPNGVPNGTYTLTNLLDASQPAAASVTVTNGSISNWIPFPAIGANAYYVLRLNASTGGPNAAPTLDVIANQTINIEDGAKAVGLTGVSDGDYCSQTLTATATRATTTVLAAPTVTATCSAGTGTLTLTPSAVGTSSVTVTLTDNGGVANGGINTFSRSFTATVTDIPKAPTNLSATQASPTSAGLTWTDNSTRETGYRIYWSTSATKPATANFTTAANATSYTITGLSTQTTYNFWVEAYSANGTSPAITASLALTLPNLALNKLATASNVETFNGVTYTAAMAVDNIDNDFNNRWSAAVTAAGANQIEWIKIDLGANYNLSRVKISWENANADSYYIMASASNITPDPANASWSKVNITGKANQQRTDDQTVAITGRYLAIYCYHKTQQYGYSIYELQAYGLAASGNQAPNANAGPDQNLAFTATTATLTAAGSSDPEGSALSYTWSKVSGPAMTFSSTTAVSPTISGLTSGSTYVFQVSVSDGSLSSTDQIQVKVATNQPPVANAGPDQNLAAGTTIATLTAAASTEPNGQTMTYAWTKVSGPAATFSSTTAVSPTVSGLTAGTYVFQVSVSDGSLASTDQVQVIIAATGTAPKYYIINRWQGTYLFDNATQVKYAATASGTAYQWTLETVGSNTRIRNVASGNYMNVENLGSYVQCTSVPDTYTSSQWALEPYAGYTRIRNIWQSGAYVHVENLTGFAQYGSVDATFYSGHWTFQTIAGRALATTTATKEQLAIFPNPVSNGQLQVLLPATVQAARFTLLDALGRVVSHPTATVQAGHAVLDVTKLPAGLYLLQAANENTTYTGKVVIE